MRLDSIISTTTNARSTGAAAVVWSGAIMPDANAAFIDALIRLLLEPCILPFTLFLIIAFIAIVIAILNILLGG